MIKNDRQLVSARKDLEGLSASQEVTEPVGGVDVYAELKRRVEVEINEYLAVRDGRVNAFAVEQFDDIASVLIKARISQKLTQKELAKKLDVAEQSVQRDEAGGYENATLTRIADVADVLGYELNGLFKPVKVELSDAEFDKITFSEWHSITPQVVTPIRPIESVEGSTATIHLFPTLTEIA